MRRDKFFSLVQDVFIPMAVDIMRNKGRNYAGDNTFKNFEYAAEEAGINRMQSLWVFASKQLRAIGSIVRGSYVPDGEPMETRFLDAINFLLLALAMLAEEDSPHTSQKFRDLVNTVLNGDNPDDETGA